MDLASLQLLIDGLLHPSWISLVCYGAVYYVAALVLVSLAPRIRRSTSRDITSPKRLLIASALTSVVVGISLPVIYRLIPSETPSHVWECDSVLLFFSAFVNDWSIWDFTKYAVITKPGVLAASAHTLFWGAPTYAAMRFFGWNNFTFLSFSLLFGVGSVIVGFRIAKLLFNSGVAWCFVLIFAVNPSLIYNMGYGVAQTGTLFAILLAVLFTFRALLNRGPLWLNAPLAASFLFGGTLNYGPGRVFVVTTLVFLGGILVTHFAWRRLDNRVTWAAFIVLFLGSTALITENRLNRGADFTSMRGEHAFHQHHWKENLIKILGDTPEVRALDPENLPTLVRARFILASARFGFRQFIDSFGPFLGLDADRRGYYAGSEVKPYQSGLIIFIIFGVCTALRDAWRSLCGCRAESGLSHWFILAFFFISLMPLTLVNRLDQHRSFILVFPLSIWAAVGLWACIRRIYANGAPGFIVSGLALALSASLSASAWRTFGIQEYRNPNLSLALSHFTRTNPPADVIGGAGLICQDLAPLDFSMANLSMASPRTPRAFFPHLFLFNFLDRPLSANPEIIKNYLNNYGSARAAFVSSDPMRKFEEALKSAGFSVERTQFGDYYSWVVQH